MLDTDVKVVYQRPRGFEERPTYYCPGCTHGVAHRLIAEVLEEMGELEHTMVSHRRVRGFCL
jgi:2-oxoglutarate ferredoxin oxidoreductase subunit beta